MVDDNKQFVLETIVEIRLGKALVATMVGDASGKAIFTLSSVGAYSLNLRGGGCLPVQTVLEIGKDHAVSEIDVVLNRATLNPSERGRQNESSNPWAETSTGPTARAPAKASDTHLRHVGGGGLATAGDPKT